MQFSIISRKQAVWLSQPLDEAVPAGTWLSYPTIRLQLNHHVIFVGAGLSESLGSYFLFFFFAGLV